jgi:hypothetical protein
MTRLSMGDVVAWIIGTAAGIGIAVLLTGWLFAAHLDMAGATLDRAEGRVATCAGLGRRIERVHRIHWVVDTTRLLDSLRAYTTLPDTVTIGQRWVDDVPTVAHEMLHVMIGRPGHPGIPFATCGVMWPGNEDWN